MTLQRPRTTTVLLSLCLIIVLDSLLSPKFQSSVHEFVRENGNNIFVDDSLTDNEKAILLGSEIESLIQELELDDNKNHVNRFEIMEEGFGGQDYDMNYITAQQRHATGGKTSPNADKRTYHNLIHSKLPLSPYNLKGVVDSTLIYDGALAILVYDPADDKFILSYSRRHPWHTENGKMLDAFQVISYLLRALFPERFKPDKSEFAMAISSGTFPHVSTTDCAKQYLDTGLKKEPCVESHFISAPILHFGHVFPEDMYPNIVPMPSPDHLGCFRQWAETKTICEELQHLVYGNEGLNWDRLSPQVIWRGEDYGYMANVPPGQKISYNGLRSTVYKGKDSISNWEKDKDVPLAFHESYSTLLARWKGVLLTYQSVVDWKRKRNELGRGQIPWCNIKFNRYENEVGYSKQWEETGMPVVGDRIDQKELSKYRYHIDLAGSSWEVRLQQLAKPGLLFHNVMPTRDSIDDHMEPWVHYIPVAPHLDDLKQKFEWAEQHPEEAKNIARKGTELARYLTSSDGLDYMFQEDLVVPLRQVVEAYHPLSEKGHKNWRREIAAVYTDSIVPVMKCNGTTITADCERLVGEKAFASTQLKRENCQIIYIVGVEGSNHHGFLPIIKSLAAKQIDPDTGFGYDVDEAPEALKAGLFGWYRHIVQQKWKFGVDPGVHDPAFVKSIVSSMCPNDGLRHVVIEWASFPSGNADDFRSYRVHRQSDWLHMSPQEIANDKNAMIHPVDLNAFYDAYAPHAEIKFVVLNRDYTETIASHKDWDGGSVTHSHIISGFMIILSRFLNSHLHDSITGAKLWTLLCLESIFAKNHQTAVEVSEARRNVLHNLATFLDWPVKECPDCFNHWYESTKIPEQELADSMEIIFDHISALEGIWPPKRSDDTMPEQQCGLLTKKATKALESPASTPVTIYFIGTWGMRAQSIFHTGLIDRYGTGRVEYIFEHKPDCQYSELTKQHDGPCLAINYFEFKKCSLNDMIRQYPECKTMLTNDENCADNRYDARGYYSSKMTGMTYLPLGPRYDSWEALNVLRQNGSIIAASSQRKYAFNAIFAENTHVVRTSLADILQREGTSLSSFVKISSAWRPNPNDDLNDLVETSTYMQVLLESTFTLAPSGHNPECFRLYEAVEAGSIPVISLDKHYRDHECKDSLFHWLDSPIVIVESWNEVIPTLQKLLEEPEALDVRQENLLAWYDQYMRSAVTKFESFLLSEK